MGTSLFTKKSMSSTWRKLPPWVRGMKGFTSAATTWAHSTALFTTSTETPSEQKPWASGGLVEMRATSMGSRRERKSPGISERKAGV
jgi:hypothetical protein